MVYNKGIINKQGGDTMSTKEMLKKDFFVLTIPKNRLRKMERKLKKMRHSFSVIQTKHDLGDRVCLKVIFQNRTAENVLESYASYLSGYTTSPDPGIAKKATEC